MGSQVLLKVKTACEEKPIFYACTFLVLIVFVCYANVVSAPFIWDDWLVILSNDVVKDISNWKLVFTTGMLGAGWEAKDFFRPVQIFSHLIEYSIWQQNQIGYHLTSIFIHALNAILLFFLLLKFDLKKTWAYGISLIFAVHAVNTTSVAYISARGDVLGLFFSLLCFLLFILALKKAWLYPLSLISLILAILSKENFVPIALIIGAYVFLFQDKTLRNWKQITWLAILNAGSFAYIIYRAVATITQSGTPSSWIGYASLWERVLTFPKILITYLKLLVFPYPLHVEYHFVERSLTSPYIWLGLPLLIALTIFLFVKSNQKRKFLFYSFWFIVGLAPVSNIIVPLLATMRENWLYFPGIGFLLLMALLYQQLIDFIQRKEYSKITIVLKIFPLVFIIYLAVFAIIRNNDWNDPLTFFQHEVEHEPMSHMALNNLGGIYFQEEDFIAAKEVFEKAVESSPAGFFSDAYFNLGLIAIHEEEYDYALYYFQDSTRGGNYENANAQIGRVYLLQDNLEAAKEILEEGYNLYPNNPWLLYYLSQYYIKVEDNERAIQVLTELQYLYPNFQNVESLISALSEQENSNSQQ
ncbi:tetratricopeptide repeat protein [Patescibacteria group bacterium]